MNLSDQSSGMRNSGMGNLSGIKGFLSRLRGGQPQQLQEKQPELPQNKQLQEQCDSLQRKIERLTTDIKANEATIFELQLKIIKLKQKKTSYKKNLTYFEEDSNILKQQNESIQAAYKQLYDEAIDQKDQFAQKLLNQSQLYACSLTQYSTALKEEEQKINKYKEFCNNLKKNTVPLHDHEILKNQLKKLQQDSTKIIDLQEYSERLNKKITSQKEQSDKDEETIKKLKQKILDSEKQLLDQFKQSKASIEQLQDENYFFNLKIQSLQQTDTNNSNSNPSIFEEEAQKLSKQVRQQSNEIQELTKSIEEMKASNKIINQQMIDYQQEITKLKFDLEQEHKYYLQKLDVISDLNKKMVDKNKDIQIKEESLEGLEHLNKKKADLIQKLELENKYLKEKVLTLEENVKELNQSMTKLMNQLLNQKGNVNPKQNQAFIDEMNIIQKKLEEQRQKQIQDQKDQQKRFLDELQRQNQLNNEWEKEKKERTKKIQSFQQEIIKTHGQLEVCFLVDCTGSMDPYKEQTMQSISGSMEIIKKETGRDVKWSTVCYQDYEEWANLGNQYHQLDFTSEPEQFKEYLKGVECNGGGDGAEDIRGGIIQMCQKISWKTQFRLAILICDAPSHGVNSNGGCGDYHPNDDIRDAILMLIKKNITLMGVNFTAHTETMYSYIEKIFAEHQKQDQFHLINMEGLQQENIWKQLIEMILKASKLLTLTDNNETYFKGDTRPSKDGAIEALFKAGKFQNFEEQEGLELVETNFKVMRVDIKLDSFNSFIEDIHKIQVPKDYEVSEEGNWKCIRTVKPFAQGNMKEVYLMKKKNATNELYVIKMPLGGKTYTTLNNAITECRSHLVSKKLMKQFIKDVNDACDVAKSKGQEVKQYPQIFYSDFLILEESPNSFWIAERFFEGDFVKYNNNYSYISKEETQLNQMAQAFSYYTFHLSNLKYMVIDIQGVGIYFTDPAINTKQGKFDPTDMSEDGIAMFLVSLQAKKTICKEILDLLGLY